MRNLLTSRTTTPISILSRLLLLNSFLLLSCCAHAQPNLKPQIYTYQKSAKPGDVVYFEGANLANASVYLAGYGQLQTYTAYSDNNLTVQLPSVAKGALDVYIVNPNGSSPTYYLNAAQPYNLDATQIAPGAPFRIMGKNLYMTGYNPIVTIGGQTAALNLARSTETMLVGTVPVSLNKGPAAITVDNGNGSGPTALLEVVSVIAGSSADPFNLGVGWASSFAPIAAITIDPTTNPNVSPHMVGDGTTDNTAALQAAINYVHGIGGGTITIPPGTYYLVAMAVMSSNVVISGAGTAQTILTYPASSYPIIAYGDDLVGLANLTISTGSKTNSNNLFLSNLTHSFLKNVVISSINGQQIYAYNNTNFAIENSTLKQTGIGFQGQGVIYLANGEGLLVTGNTFDFQAGSAMNILGTNDSYIGGNNIIIDASAQNAFIPGQNNAQSPSSYYTTHGLVLDFNRRVTIDSNSFSVVNGPFTNIYRNDGEAILSEGGGPYRTESEGNVASATLTTLTDGVTPINLSNNFGFPGPYSVVIIAGTGMGQRRNIVSYTSNTLTIDTPWSVVPDSTSVYMTVIPDQVNLLISNNTFNQWPAGTILYFATVDTVDILNNTYTNGGGIAVITNENGYSNPREHNVALNVNITSNSVTSAVSSVWGAWITAGFVDFINPTPEGIGGVGLVFKNNLINSNNSTFTQYSLVQYPGFGDYMLYQGWSAYTATATPQFIGTIFQGNTCNGCSVGFRSGTGVYGNVYYHNISSGALTQDTYTTPGQLGSQQSMSK